MVLPTPSAHDQQGPGVAWVEPIAETFRLIERGVIVLVDDASSSRLGELVRSLIVEHPQIEVFTEAPSLEDAPHGAVVVLAARLEDALWLNYARPIFSERAFKVVLWSTTAVTGELSRRAPDFFDWISRRFECPAGPPVHAILGLRAAMRARAPGVWWRGSGLEAAFAAAFPGRPLIRASASLEYGKLIETAARAGRGWIVWSNVNDPYDLLRVRWALAEAGRRGRVLLDNPRVDAPGFWLMHGRSLKIAEARRRLEETGTRAPGRLAALLGLEPEAIGLTLPLLKQGVSSSVVEEAALRSCDPGAAMAKLAQAHGTIVFDEVASVNEARRRLQEGSFIPGYIDRVARFHAVSPVLRAFSRDDRVRWVRDAQWQKKLKGARASIARSGVAYLDDVEALLRAGPKSEAEWAALIRATSDRPTRDVADRWTSRAPAEADESHAPNVDGRFYLSRHAETCRWLAKEFEKQGKFDKAASNLRIALAIEERLGGPEDPKVGQTLSFLAGILAAQGHHDVAEPLAERALAIARSTGREASPEIAMALRQLAASRSVLGRPDAAETAREALDALHAAFEPDDPAIREAEPHLNRIIKS